jgi:Fe2+ transport system protein FeoA
VYHGEGKMLSKLKPGDTGRITGVFGSGMLRRRILEMGLVPGTKIKVKGMAPMGDPIEILVKGYSLTLRRQEAEAVTVEVS